MRPVKGAGKAGDAYFRPRVGGVHGFLDRRGSAPFPISRKGPFDNDHLRSRPMRKAFPGLPEIVVAR